MKRALAIALAAAVLTLLLPMLFCFDVQKTPPAKKEETAVSQEQTAAPDSAGKQEEKAQENETDQSELITIFEG